IAPQNVQALIWRELVPGLLVNATLPRWWDVSPHELHAITLYQRAGEELLAASAGNESLRIKVMSILSDRMNPAVAEQVELALRGVHAVDIYPEVTPADTLYVTAEFERKFPTASDSWGPAGLELQNLSRQYPTEVNWQRLSQDFGVPHPILGQSYVREL